MANVEKKVKGQRSRSQVQLFGIVGKAFALVIRNTYADYLNPIFQNKIIVANVKVFQK